MKKRLALLTGCVILMRSLSLSQVQGPSIPAKQKILKLVVVSLLVSTAFLTRLCNAQVSGHQKSSTTTIQATPPEKTVEQVFKNIKVLNGMPQSQVYPAMRFMAASLGTQCGFCHVFKNGQLDSAADDKPEKQTAREMIKLVLDINKTLAEGSPTVSCFTCHRGLTSPQRFPTLPLPLPSPRSPLGGSAAPGASARTASNSTPVLPSADEILNKYTTAIGGRTVIEQIHSCVIKGTASTSNDLFTGQQPVQLGQFVSYEADQVAPDKAYETFIIQKVTYERVINGPRGWLKNSAGMTELIGQQLAEQKLSFPLFMILRLKDQYASLLVSAQDKIDDQDVMVVNAIRPDNKRERLYFDIESGLLRRRISYTPTMIGIIPQQTDFEDYREVEGLRLPFTIRASYVDAGSPIVTRKFAEIRLNTPVDESKFNKPVAIKAPAP